MGNINYGNQIITWKYKTPLKSEDLSTSMFGSNPGLLTRPKLSYNLNTTSVTISPFALIISPSDSDVHVDANGTSRYWRLVKILVTSPYTLTVSSDTIGIGFKYSHKTDSMVSDETWYGDFVALSLGNVEGFKGVIIATNLNGVWTTHGADLSDDLLREEGQDPSCWVTLMSPRRWNSQNPFVELRTHNESFNKKYITTSNVLKNSVDTYPLRLVPDYKGTSDTELVLFKENESGLLSCRVSELSMSNFNKVLALIKKNSNLFEITPLYDWNQNVLNTIKSGNQPINRLTKYPPSTSALFQYLGAQFNYELNGDILTISVKSDVVQ